MRIGSFSHMTYKDFLTSEINPALKPHQRDAVRWALKGGRRALFEEAAAGLKEAARTKRESIDARVQKMREIVEESQSG